MKRTSYDVPRYAASTTSRLSQKTLALNKPKNSNHIKIQV